MARSHVISGESLEQAQPQIRTIGFADLKEVLHRLELGAKRPTMLLLPNKSQVGATNLLMVGSNPRGNEVSGLWYGLHSRDARAPPN